MKFISIVLLLSALVLADNRADWQTITTFNEIYDLAVDQDKIWAASSGGLFYYRLAGSEIRKFDNIDGLKSIMLRAVEVDNHANVITGGDDGLIELYSKQANSWRQFYNLQGNSINDILYQNDTLWVVAGKGLAVFVWDGASYNFKDYFQNFKILPRQVFYAQLFANRIWLATDVGLYNAPADLDRYNINDPATWTLFTTQNGLPANSILDLQVINGNLWVGTSSGLATINAALQVVTESGWIKNSAQKYIAANFMAQAGDTVFVSSGRDYYYYTPASGYQGVRQMAADISKLISDKANKLWIGLKGEGLCRTDWEKPLRLDGPAYNAFRFVIRDNRGWIWASPSKPKHYRSQGFYQNKGDGWLHNWFDISNWAHMNGVEYFYEDRFNNIWCSTWGGGLFAFTPTNDMYFFHNFTMPGELLIRSDNSTQVIQLNTSTTNIYNGYFAGVVSEPTFEVITAVKEDQAGRLWVVNYWATNDHLLAVIPYEANGFINLNQETWTYFGGSDGIVADEGGIISMEIDQQNRVWLGTINNGVFILDHNNTLNDRSDDKLTQLQINDNLYSNRVYSIAADHDGIVWIGTSGGLNSYDGVNVYKHVGDSEGKSGPLENQISHIAVDRFNNKWFATRGGLSVLRSGKSPWDANAWQGYTTANSGLVDNEVHRTYIDEQRSEALVGTERGLSIYRGTFAEIQNDYRSTIGGPNPFIIDDVKNVFTLKNLKNNSIVKIYNLNGNLIKELSAQKFLSDGTAVVEGSRAYWDGRDLLGKPVASGIYLFMAFSEDGTSTAGKIAVIRK